MPIPQAQLRDTKVLSHACTLPDPYYLGNLSYSEWLKAKWLDLVCISVQSPLSRNYFKSNEEIKTERKKQMSSNQPYYIHPLSKFRAVYEIYLAFFIAIMIFSKLAEHGFTRLQLEFFPHHREVSVFLDLLCFLDICINFFTGYIDDRNDDMVMDPKKIAKHYILGPFFICDLLSATPRQIWYLIMSEEQILSDQMLYFLGVLNILCCFRLIRLITLIQIIYRIEEYFQMNMKNVLFPFCSLIIMLLLLHFFTCMQYGVSRTVRIYFVPRKERKFDSWIYTNDLYYQNFHKRYLHAFFKSSAYLLGIKVKLYEHKLPEEYALAITTYTTGKVLLGIVWVMLSVSILSAKKLEIKYQEIIDQLSCYMTQRGVTAALRNRILQFYHFLYQKEFFKEKAVAAVLPARLKDEVNVHMCYWLIKNVHIFEGLSQSEVSEVVSRLRPQIYLPKDRIITARRKADGMFFISSGTVAVYTHSGKELCHLHDGHYFGEIGMLKNSNRYAATVVAIEITKVYMLPKRDFHSILLENEVVSGKIAKKAEKLAKMIKVEEDKYKKMRFEEAYKAKGDQHS
ncbi:unnamed protein product [Acanthoscelides obtectus]|uniref:Cyclic nucleotide-binding domain-containing protein n=2 Tax=Acanthoscelides obtectus TaxID=200917 RepID=A0A9P0LRS5_ACAOB|nr:unnamed protein product [Acanthoscelides obtectus]CAK1677572.1 Potassium/sodium hyperpolarization-activated cyclic nucleotide-gated channel 2 [Acanthoscelides obtectus]